jgi:hypothetical protein
MTYELSVPVHVFTMTRYQILVLPVPGTPSTTRYRSCRRYQYRMLLWYQSRMFSHYHYQYLPVVLPLPIVTLLQILLLRFVYIKIRLFTFTGIHATYRYQVPGTSMAATVFMQTMGLWQFLPTSVI